VVAARIGQVPGKKVTQLQHLQEFVKEIDTAEVR
jgi:hypothetical protein